MAFETTYLSKWQKLGEEHLAGNLSLLEFRDGVKKLWHLTDKKRETLLEAIHDDYSKEASSEATERVLQAVQLWEEGVMLWLDYAENGEDHSLLEEGLEKMIEANTELNRGRDIFFNASEEDQLDYCL